MTTKKIFQVFVSSTFVDLQEERSEVIQSLLELDCIPVAMEQFPASDETQWEVIQRVITDCDYYIVVVKNRYGSIHAESGLSYTEREYDYAVEQKIPVLGFLHSAPGEVCANWSDIDKGTIAKLEAFRRKIETRHVRFWKTPTELSGTVSRSMHHMIKRTPRQGWVRASERTEPSVVLDLHDKIRELEEELALTKSSLSSYPPNWSGDEVVNVSFKLRRETGLQHRTTSLGEFLRHAGYRFRRGVSETQIFTLVQGFLAEKFLPGVNSADVDITVASKENLLCGLEFAGVVSIIGHGTGSLGREPIYGFTDPGMKAYVRMIAGSAAQVEMSATELPIKSTISERE